MIPGSAYQWFVHRVEAVLGRELKSAIDIRAAWDHFNARMSAEQCAEYIARCA